MTAMSEPEYGKYFLQDSLPPTSLVFGAALMSYRLMEIMVKTENGEIYGFGNLGDLFVLALRRRQMKPSGTN